MVTVVLIALFTISVGMLIVPSRKMPDWEVFWDNSVSLVLCWVTIVWAIIGAVIAFGPDLTKTYDTTVNGQRYFCDRLEVETSIGWYWPGAVTTGPSADESLAVCYLIEG